MTDETVLGHLREVGFSLYEAKAYVALLRKAPVNGHELSRLANIPPPKIYETLRGLQAKGAVVAHHSEPVLYAPEPYPQLLARLRARMDTTLAGLSTSLQGLEAAPAPGLTWTVRGYSNLLDRLRTQIAGTAHELFLLLWQEETDALRPALRAAQARGVALQIALQGTAALGVEQVYDISHFGPLGYYTPARRLTVAVTDGQEALTALLHGGDADQGVWTGNPAMVILAREYVRGEIMARLLVQGMGEKRYRRLRQDDQLVQALLQVESETR